LKGKKKIRRKPGKKRNMYFNMDTQAAIVKYQKEEVHDERIKTYVKDVLPAFQKLSESLIFTYRFNSPFSNFEELKADCVSFLYESIHKWKEEKGTKAYSYFNVVAKNWLINNTRKHKKIRNRNLSIDDPYSMTATQASLLENYQIALPPDQLLTMKAQRSRILVLLEDMRVKLTNENELICLQAIETLFANIEDLELLNKRAVLVYIREISGLDKKCMAKALSVIRRRYREMSGDSDNYDIFF
jgi:DNA-directed RNA polymerase specialized sigma24 family protein